MEEKIKLFEHAIKEKNYELIFKYYSEFLSIVAPINKLLRESIEVLSKDSDSFTESSI